MTTIYEVEFYYEDGARCRNYYDTLDNAEREAEEVSQWARNHQASIFPCVPDEDGQFSFTAYGGSGIHYINGERI